jgi:hypothetical protein
VSMGVDASIAWLWTSGIPIFGNVGGGFTEGRATIAARDAYESEVDAGVLSTIASPASAAGNASLPL